MIYTLANIKHHQDVYSVIIKSKIVGNNTRPQYRLLNRMGLNFILSNGKLIHVPFGFIWDGSSVPRFAQWLLSTDGDFEIASMIHDYLYENKKEVKMSRKMSDDEMLKWSKVLNSTKAMLSFRNFDNYLRYYVVRLFGYRKWTT